jgi:hypothetical protein
LKHISFSIFIAQTKPVAVRRVIVMPTWAITPYHLGHLRGRRTARTQREYDTLYGNITPLREHNTLYGNITPSIGIGNPQWKINATVGIFMAVKHYTLIIPYLDQYSE